MSANREFQPGDELGAFRLERRLGGGGFGSVWKALPVAGGEPVALKILNVRSAGSASAPLRAEIELLAAAAVSSSPNIVRVLGGEAEPVPYVVMEYVSGTDLGQEIDRRASLTPPRAFAQGTALHIGISIAGALDVLHRNGIVHRDVKPANVMLDNSRVIKLADFGIAKIVGFDSVATTSQTPMSMAYAAPEVWEGKATHKSDLYALGCVLFHCLTGRPPFVGSYADLFRQHQASDPDWSALPPETVPALRGVLELLLLKDADQRPPDAATVVELLELAERELSQGPEASPSQAVHEPKALGPWVIEKPHRTHSGTFLCRHEITGQRATVEVHFDDDLEYGSRLRSALAVNPSLVPLRAERLIDTNRLMFRPGEGWLRATPKKRFQFWVARDEVPQPPGPDTVDETTLKRLAGQLLALQQEAANQGFALPLPAEDLEIVGEGNVYLLRPGLDSSGQDGFDWLRTLPLTGGAQALLGRASTLAALAAAELAEPGLATPVREQVEEVASAPRAAATEPVAAPTAPRRPTTAALSRPSLPPEPLAQDSPASQPKPPQSRIQTVIVTAVVLLAITGTGLLAFVAVALFG